MGFFDFLKKKETITFKESEDWINNYMQEKNPEKKFKALKEEWKNNITETKEKLKDLETADYMNENIPERAKHLVEGHKRSYPQKLLKFLEKIQLPDNYQDIPEFKQEFREEMVDFTAETQKSYMVLKEFVETEFAEVAKKIKAMEQNLKNFTNYIEQEKLEEAKTIKKLFQEYEDAGKKIKDLKKQKKQSKKDLKELKKELVKKEKELDTIKKSKEHKEYNQLKENLEKIKKECLEKEKEIFRIFSELERPLKKYKRMSLNEKIIDLYLENSIRALKKDQDLEIRTELRKIKESLSKLGLKERKEEKIKQEIQEILSTDKLKNKREDLERLEKKKEEIASSIKKSRITEKIKSKETEVLQSKSSIKSKEQEIKDISSAIKNNDPEAIKNKIKEELQKMPVILHEQDQ